MNIKWIGASKTNFGVGRDGNSVSLIVLHWMAGTLESTDATFNNPQRLASAHYGIGGSEVHQYVDEKDTAWHCGNLSKNKQSIGIEHEGSPTIPVSESTVQTSIQLVADICRRYNISPSSDTIKRHSDIKATQCPGTLPVERIISEVKKLLQPASPQPEQINDQTKISIGEPWGVLEVQAIRSLLNDQKKTIDSLNTNVTTYKEIVDELNSQVTGEKTKSKTLESQQQLYAETLGCADNHPAILAEIKKLIEKEDQSADAKLGLGLIAILRKVFGLKDKGGDVS